MTKEYRLQYLFGLHQIRRGDVVILCAKIAGGGDEFHVVIAVVVLLEVDRVETRSILQKMRTSQ